MMTTFFSSLGTVPLGTDVLESYFLNPRAELRFPLIWGFGGALFYDGGNTFFVGAPSRSFRHGVGAGLRYKTPVGPLSLDFGVNVNPLPGEDSFRVHFAIGSF